jgi:hypothetical protein
VIDPIRACLADCQAALVAAHPGQFDTLTSLSSVNCLPEVSTRQQLTPEQEAAWLEEIAQFSEEELVGHGSLKDKELHE